MQSLEERIKEKQRELRAVSKELAALLKEQEELEKQEFFKNNKIYKEDVQLGHCDNIPSFHHVREFLKWLKQERSEMEWYEWNGSVFNVEEALEGNLKAVCTYEELEWREDPLERMKREFVDGGEN